MTEQNSAAPLHQNRRQRGTPRRPRARLEGMTLVEIMIVVIIMALIATGVAVAVLPQLERAREDDTRVRAAAIHTVAVLEYANSECPTVEELVERHLVTGEATDGWGNPYTIECQGGQVLVTSDRYDGENIIPEDEQ